MIHNPKIHKMNAFSEMLKRSFDFLAALTALLLLSPILLAVALIIKIGSPGPIFYRGVRIGLRGAHFRIYKFRTMVINAERLGGSATAEDDPRITPIGRLLRRHKLDELPQFLNVLVGDRRRIFAGCRLSVRDRDNQPTDTRKNQNHN